MLSMRPEMNESREVGSSCRLRKMMSALRRRCAHCVDLHTFNHYTSPMGALLSIPLAGVFGTVGSSCLAGLAFCFTSTAGKPICVQSTRLF